MKFFKKRAKFLIAGLLVLGLAGCGSSGEEAGTQGDSSGGDSYKPEPSNISFATGPIGGGWYQTGASIAELLMREIPGLNITVTEGGAEANIRDVSDGVAHLGYTFSDTINDAINGKSVFSDGAIENVGGVASLYTSYYQAFTVPNSKYNSFEDLADGAHILPGMKNWGGELLTQNVLDKYGINYEDIENNGGKISYTTFGDMTPLLSDGHADVAMGVTAAPSSMIMELAALKGVKFLEIPTDVAEKIQSENAGYIPSELPANTYEGQEEPIPTLASYSVIFASNDLPEELVERITQVIIEHKDELIENNEAMTNFSEEIILDGFNGVPIHPGAEKVINK